MSQTEGRSHNSNFSFEGSTLYSYSTPIAQIYRTPSGPVVLLTTEGYSMTTKGKHINAVWRATSYGRSMPVFVVPFIGAWGGQATRVDYGKPDAERHAGNLAHLVQAYRDGCARFRRMRDLYSGWERYLTEWSDNATRYASTFGIDAPMFEVAKDTADIAAIREQREQRNADPAYQAKRELDRQKREARKAEREATAQAERAEREQAEREAWLAGARNWFRGRDARGGALLRVNGDTLETSQGASVPLDHAVKAFRFVKLCRDRGEGWKRNGHTIHVGHFHVDQIAANGDFHAGCHFITWDECERVARAIGIFDEAPSAEALELSHA
jgi:hypothetical protein